MCEEVLPEIQIGAYYEDCRYAPIYCLLRDDEQDDLNGIDLQKYHEKHGTLDGYKECRDKDLIYCCSILHCGARPIFEKEAEMMATESDKEWVERQRRIHEQTDEYAKGGPFRAAWMEEFPPLKMVYDPNEKCYVPETTTYQVFRNGEWQVVQCIWSYEINGYEEEVVERRLP